MSTSSVKIKPVEVESFDILELAVKTPQALADLLNGDTELHICVTHRDLDSHQRSQMIFQAVENITEAIVEYSKKNTVGHHDILPQLREGVQGFLRESVTQFHATQKDIYIQMDIRLLCIKEPNGTLSLSTKTSFIDASGNYKSLNQ